MCDSSSQATNRAWCRQVRRTRRVRGSVFESLSFKCLGQRGNGRLSDRRCPRAQKQASGKTRECPDLRLSVQPLRGKQPIKCHMPGNSHSVKGTHSCAGFAVLLHGGTLRAAALLRTALQWRFGAPLFEEQTQLGAARLWERQ